MALPAPLRAAALALAGLLAAGCSQTAGQMPDPPPAPATATATARAGTPLETPPVPPLTPPTFDSCLAGCRQWHQMLTALDERRERAYVTARPGLLADVYAPASSMLRADQATLDAWSARGITVSEPRLDLLDLEVRHVGRRSARLRVVDRLAPMTATLPGGRTVSLPRDRATARLIELRRVAGQWRIASSRRLAS